VTSSCLPRFLHFFGKHAGERTPGLTEDGEANEEPGRRLKTFSPSGTAYLGVPSVPSPILPKFLRFWRRTGEWFWHGFESEFGLVFTEAGTEGTGSKIDLKKRAKFLGNPGKCENSEDQAMGTNWNCHESAELSKLSDRSIREIPGKKTANGAEGRPQKWLGESLTTNERELTRISGPTRGGRRRLLTTDRVG